VQPSSSDAHDSLSPSASSESKEEKVKKAARDRELARERVLEFTRIHNESVEALVAINAFRAAAGFLPGQRTMRLSLTR
jgi:hypothetical protein